MKFHRGWLIPIVVYGLLGLALLTIQSPRYAPEVITYFRWALFLASALLIMITRPVIPMVRSVPSRGVQQVLAWILWSPSIVIPIAGYLLAYFAGSKTEFVPFLILGGFHLFRFYPSLKEVL